MNKYSHSFITFAKDRMAWMGDEIKRWAHDSNPLLAQVCREIIEAAGQAGDKP